MEPALYLLVFSVGLGSSVVLPDGRAYLDFIGTGVVAPAILSSSVYNAMFDGLNRRSYQKIYHTLLAAPVAVVDIATGEVAFLALKAGLFAAPPLLLSALLGLELGAGALWVPVIGALTGFGLAAFGLWASAHARSVDDFNYIITLLLVPLLLLAGTFFPVTAMPEWLQALTLLNPLYHAVELVRASVFSELQVRDVGHLAALIGFAVIAWLGSVRSLGKALLD
jgi:lipooligosaccharide transport system permease protein